MKTPYPFDEFFASDLEESISPFLTPDSQQWGKNLALKSAIVAAILLLTAFIISFHYIILSYFFLSIVFFLVGVRALLSTLEDFKNFEINIDVLMTLSAFLSIIIGSPLEGALLLVLFELSGSIEEAVTLKAKGTLQNLYVLAPKTAILIASDGALYEKSIKEIEVGTRIFVKSGEVVPLDGKVIEGVSSVNLVHLTGESEPVSVKPGELVSAGSSNLEGALTIEITRTSSDSTLARITQLILQAAASKPKVERFFDRFGKKYALLVIVSTFAFIFFLPLLFSLPFLGQEGSIYRSLAFMIAASPCALIIATPTAYLSAISACAKKGILLKGGITLDALSSCKIISFDKTGTLSTGELLCTAMEPFDLKALQVAAGLERQVVHPIAKAIIKFAEEKGAPFLPITDVRPIPGYGIHGNCEGKEVTIGKIEGATTLRIQETSYTFSFSESLRTGAGELIKNLKDAGLEPLMMTGDSFANAKKIADLLSIDTIHADLRPEQKLALVEKLSENKGLAMVGDGINDAPALARATVGISLGKIASATAQDASDVILLNDELFLLHFLFDKAKKTLRLVKQNITLALIVILFATTPALLGFVPLWLAVILHEGGTVLVGLNSLRLLKK